MEGQLFELLHWICLISDVIACSGNVVNITSCPVRVSFLIGWLATQEGVTMETKALSG